jgi:hypothetical protein
VTKFQRQPSAAGNQLQYECITLVVVFKSVRDSDWSAGHVAAHGVTLAEVREAILERPYWAVPGRDGTTLVYGRTYAGRYLFAVVIAEAEEAFVVTARDMTDNEKKTFRRKAR